MAITTVGDTSPVPSPATAKAIQARLIPDAQRPQFLPRVFGRRFFMQGEAAIYTWMRRLCPEYSGGYWDFVDLSNGGFYLRLDTDRPVTLHVDGNGFSGAMSADAASIVVTLFAINELLFAGVDELEDAYYALRDYGIEHAECASILHAID